jgi:hypothetical protein
MTRPIPTALRQLARTQAGVVSRQQAIRSGMSERSLDWLLARGTWQTVHRAAYATFSGPPGRDARLWAALLHAGRGARLSHETAAELVGLTDRREPLIHVKIPAARHIARTDGLVVHRSRRPDPGWRHPLGMPAHTLAEETIVDLVDAADQLDTVIGWVTAGFGRRLTGERALRDEAGTCPRLRWRDQLDEVIGAASGGVHSVLEYRYERDVALAHGLPAAARQFRYRKPDGRWGFRDRYHEHYRLVVELDGKQAHPADRREADENRDNHAAVLGGSTLRFGWADVTRRPCETAATEALALRERGWSGRLRPCSATCRALAATPGASGGVPTPARGAAGAGVSR